MRDKQGLGLSAWLIAAAIAGVLVACTTTTAGAGPVIALSTEAGGPGTRITVTGSGFPPGMRLYARLGPPNVGATPKSYGSAASDARGELSLTFTMPGEWPDGTPIAQDELIVVVLNEDGSVKALAPFAYDRVPTVPPAHLPQDIAVPS